MRFCVINLGCKVNRVESDALIASLQAYGGEASCEQEADLIVINTCTVTGEAEKKTRKAVRHALKVNLEGLVFVTGCSVAIDGQKYLDMDPRVRIFKKGDFQNNIETIVSEFKEQVTKNDLPVDFNTIAHQRIGVKVQDGCNNACTFCIVHTARGPAISRPIHEIVEECVKLAHCGVPEIVLTGINLGSYRCINEVSGDSLGLGGLLLALLNETSQVLPGSKYPVRFRISSIEPCDVDEKLIEVISSSEGRVCRHLHLPLQSGSSKVLKEMARPYDSEDFCKIVESLREAMPHISLTTDIIVGFPGETEEDFLQTLEIARLCRFSKIHVFPYSMRQGTPAAQRTDQVSGLLKHERVARLRLLGDELRKNELAALKGSYELAVVEKMRRATTESYFELHAPEESVVGEMIRIQYC